jgi:hypothetical protein
LNLDILPTLFNCSADTLKDNDNDNSDKDINNNMSPRSTERQRSALPHCEHYLRHNSPLFLLYNRYKKGNIEHINVNFFKDLKDNDITPKRQKCLEPLQNRTDLGSNNRLS